MTKRNAENAQKANDLAKEARAVAERGAGNMQTMSSAMQSIKVRVTTLPRSSRPSMKLPSKPIFSR